MKTRVVNEKKHYFIRKFRGFENDVKIGGSWKGKLGILIKKPLKLHGISNFNGGASFVLHVSYAFKEQKKQVQFNKQNSLLLSKNLRVLFQLSQMNKRLHLKCVHLLDHHHMD
jgi:hypothetical protein